MKIIAIIPAHMASVRFPNKILFPFFNLPMIEHVRRRALLSSSIDEVYVATCDFDTECPFVVPLVFEIFDMMI